MHQVLDEGARDHDADVQVSTLAQIVPRHCTVSLVEGFDILRLLHPLGHRHILATVAGAHHGFLGPSVVSHNLIDAAGRKRIAPRDAHVLVRLLVVDHHVARVHVAVAHGLHLRRGHDVELADLRVAREHLDRVAVVGDLEGLRREDAAAAEGTRLEAGDALLEAGLRRGAALLIGEFC